MQVGGWGTGGQVNEILTNDRIADAVFIEMDNVSDSIQQSVNAGALDDLDKSQTITQFSIFYLTKAPKCSPEQVCTREIME